VSPLSNVRPLNEFTELPLKNAELQVYVLNEYNNSIKLINVKIVKVIKIIFEISVSFL
tara:strand:- start:401 stop:574 length:174 start_codon:yes stop_codon:yes gene_type:complete